MDEFDVLSAGCLELALQEKLYACMANMLYWRKLRCRYYEEWVKRNQNLDYWQKRLREYFRAAVVLADNGLVCRTPEQMIAEAARQFKAVHYGA